jgi:diguanylate cyclase (GGDEF)-like protein
VKSTPAFSPELSSPPSEEEEELTASAEMHQGDLGENGQLVPTLTVLGGSSYNVGKTFRIDGDETIVGRWSKAAIRLDDKGVSRRHAKLTRVGKGIFLTDLNSKNGTFCNGEKVNNRELKDRDKIQLGTATLLRFAYKEELDEAVQKTLYESSTKDVLTDANGKWFFLECLNKELAFSARNSPNISLMMIDVDHFKRINDTYGHQAGDYVLSSISREIHGMIRVDDTLARYGGDELVVLLRELPLRQAVMAGERIRKRIESLDLYFGECGLRVTVSIGVATKCGPEYADCEAFIRAADEQLYRAKDAGRNRVEPIS